jgi:hypothetical protein
MTMEIVLQSLQKQVEPLSQFVDLFAASLGNPSLRGSEVNRGYRFHNPDVRHFCLLKSVRLVSALNAMIELARKGYIQEICVLIRTVAEFTTHIEFVLEEGPEEHRAEVDKYVRAFFADWQRGSGAEIVKAQVPQGLVNVTLGQVLDNIAVERGLKEGRASAGKLYSNIYRVFSNYVHGKYPEVMDTYGGLPGKFHLSGMSGTRKDAENLTQIQTWIESVTNTFIIMIKSLNLGGLVEKDREVVTWYRRWHETA